MTPCCTWAAQSRNNSVTVCGLLLKLLIHVWQEATRTLSTDFTQQGTHAANWRSKAMEHKHGSWTWRRFFIKHHKSNKLQERNRVFWTCSFHIPHLRQIPDPWGFPVISPCNVRCSSIRNVVRSEPDTWRGLLTWRGSRAASGRSSRLCSDAPTAPGGYSPGENHNKTKSGGKPALHSCKVTCVHWFPHTHTHTHSWSAGDEPSLYRHLEVWFLVIFFF